MLEEPTGGHDVAKREDRAFKKQARGQEMAEEGMRAAREQMAKLREIRLAREAAGLSPVGEWNGPVRMAVRPSER